MSSSSPPDPPVQIDAQELDEAEQILEQHRRSDGPR